MKKLTVIMCAAMLGGCGFFTTGKGSFNGRVVDVSWEGIFFESCEVQFQLGEQSSTRSYGSSKEKDMCEKLKSMIGKVVTVEYKTWVVPCCLTMESNYEIYGEVKN